MATSYGTGTIPSHVENGETVDSSRPLLHDQAEAMTIKGRIRMIRQRGQESVPGTAVSAMESYFDSLCYTFVLVIKLAVAVAMVVIGSMHLNDCPLEPAMPILMLVGGAAICLSTIANISFRMCCRANFSAQNALICINFILNVVFFGVFFAACFYVYPHVRYITKDNPNPAKFCDPTLFNFFFWLLNVVFLYGLIVIIFVAFVTCFAFCMLPIFMAKTIGQSG